MANTAFQNVDLSAIRSEREAKLIAHKERLLDYDAHPQPHKGVTHEFDITFPITASGWNAVEDWESTPTSTSILFDKSQYSGFTSIYFRAMLGQTNDAGEYTVWIRLVAAPITDISSINPVAGTELSFTGTGTPGNNFATDLFYTGDISDALPDGPCMLGAQGKVSDAVNAYADSRNAAVVIRFG